MSATKMKRYIELMVIKDDPELMQRAGPLFERWGIRVDFESDQKRALAKIYEQPPDVIVIDRDTAPLDGFQFYGMIKSDHALAHIRIILRLDHKHVDAVAEMKEITLDDFILDWRDLEILAFRVRLCHENSARELDANPLSRLGGNNTITRAIEKRLDGDETFAVAYVDLDNFKAYNDCYGFLRGDEVIRMAARVITTSVQNAGLADDSLVGHIGGDDFVFIVPADAVQAICENLTHSFDFAIRSFYDARDIQRGGIQATNRKGESEFFDFISISIAVAVAHPGEIEHPGQFSTITSGLKKKAKAIRGSSFVIDRRRKPEPVTP